jgi:hypothetical protein
MQNLAENGGAVVLEFPKRRTPRTADESQDLFRDGEIDADRRVRFCPCGWARPTSCCMYIERGEA